MNITITLDEAKGKELEHFAQTAGVSIEDAVIRAVDDFLQLCEVLEDEGGVEDPFRNQEDESYSLDDYIEDGNY